MFSWRWSCIAVALAVSTATAHSADIRVIGLAGMTPLMKELDPIFARQSGHKIIPRYGSGADGRRLIEAGEPFGVAILNLPLIKMFGEQGKIVSGTARELFRNGTGVVVRAGTPKPDISPPEAFKAALVRAQSIAFSPGWASDIHVEKVLAQLGIADQMKAKTKPQPLPDDVAATVARGDAELGFAAMNLLVGVPGADVVGSFPSALQEYIVFTIGLGA